MMGSLFNAAPACLVSAVMLASIGFKSAQAEAPERCTVYRDAERRTTVARWIVEQRLPDIGNVPDVAAHIAVSRPGAAASCLVIACSAHEATVYVEVAERLTEGTALVSYRIANGFWSRQVFRSSSDGLALGLWDSATAAAFAQGLADGESLSVKWKFGDGPDLEGEFDIARAKEAIAPIRTACRW
jgi:hypothetical protein